MNLMLITLILIISLMDELKSPNGRKIIGGEQISIKNALYHVIILEKIFEGKVESVLWKYTCLKMMGFNYHIPCDG